MSSKQRKLLFGNNLLETAVKKVEKQQKLIKNKKQSTSNEVMDDEESESESEQEQEQEGKILKQSNAYSFLADLEDVESLSSENVRYIKLNYIKCNLIDIIRIRRYHNK